MAREPKREEERQTHSLLERLLAVDLGRLHQPCFFSSTSSDDNLGSKPPTTRGGKGLCCLHYCSSSKEVRAGTQTGQEHGSRSWPRGHGEALLTGSLLIACSVCFHKEPRTASQGMAPPTRGCDLTHQSLIKIQVDIKLSVTDSKPHWALF